MNLSGIFWRGVVIVLLVATICFILTRASRGAQDPNRPRAPGAPVYWSYGTFQPKLGPFGEPVKMDMGMEFLRVEAQPSGNLETVQVATLKVDLMGSGSVIVGDTLYHDREIAAALDAIALREYKLAFPSALPTRRKGLRTVP